MLSVVFEVARAAVDEPVQRLELRVREGRESTLQPVRRRRVDERVRVARPREARVEPLLGDQDLSEQRALEVRVVVDRSDLDRDVAAGGRSEGDRVADRQPSSSASPSLTIAPLRSSEASVAFEPAVQSKR